jgi:hypothetical protein
MGVHKMTTQKDRPDPVAVLYNRAIVDLKDIYNCGKHEQLTGAKSPEECGPKADRKSPNSFPEREQDSFGIRTLTT